MKALRKLSPAELEKLGYSRKSERYVRSDLKRVTKRTKTVSKRQYQQSKLTEAAGKKVTLETRAKEYKQKVRKYSSPAQRKAALVKRKQATERRIKMIPKTSPSATGKLTKHVYEFPYTKNTWSRVRTILKKERDNFSASFQITVHAITDKGTTDVFGPFLHVQGYIDEIDDPDSDMIEETLSMYSGKYSSGNILKISGGKLILYK